MSPLGPRRGVAVAGRRSLARAAPWLVSLALALAWPSALAAQRAPTEIRVIVPFGPGALVKGVKVTGRAVGSCWTASLASGSRPDAWRCMVDNAIYDPCFVGFVGADQVAACFRSPWSSDVVLLTLAKPLPEDVTRPSDSLSGPPWGLELASGERCTMLTGATWGVAGMRVNYGCRGEVSVVGEIDRTTPTWRAFVLRGGAPVMRQVDIRAAYY